MKQFRAPALLIGGALTLTACSLGDKFGRLQPEVGMTIVQFAKEKRAATAGAALAGGLMVYAERADGYRAAFQLASETDTRQFKLPNGAYKFTAVGWTQTGLSGAAYCGYGGGATKPAQATFTLAGRDLDIPIVTAIATCADGNFASPNLLNSGAFAPTSFVFCGAGADLLTKNSSGSGCYGNGQESAVMLHANFGARADGVEYHAPSGRFIFTADQHTANIPELFSVTLDGSRVVQQSGKILSSGGGAGVKMASVVPGTNKIFFLAEESTAGSFTLFTSTIGQPGAARLLPSFTGNVSWYTLSRDGSHLVLLASNGARTSLYTARLLGGALAAGPQIHEPGSVGAGPGVMNHATRGEPLVSFGPEVPANPALQKLAFIANYDGANEKVHLTALDSSAINTQELTEADDGMGGTYSTHAKDLGFLVNGVGVAWIGTHTTTTGPTQVRLSRLSALGTSELISNVDTNSYFAVSPYIDHVVFSRYDGGKTKLFLRNVTAGSDLTVYTPTQSRNTDTFHGVTFFPSNRLAIFGDGESATAGRYQLIAGPVLTNGMVLVADANEDTGTEAGAGKNRLRLLPNGHAYLLSDSTSAPGNSVYYDVDFTPTTPTITEIFQGTLPKADAKMSVIGTKLLYTDGAAPSQQAYVWNGSAVLPIDNGGKLAQVKGIHVPEVAGTLPPLYANAAFLIGGLSAGPEDIFIKQNIGSAGGTDVTKLTHVKEPAPIGRFQVRMLPYHRSAGGTPVIDGDGIAGPCTAGSGGSFDGYAKSTALKIPFGNAATSPLFLTALDTYEGTSCTGSPIRRIVDEGVQALTTPAPGDHARLTVETATATFFVRDEL